jgi:hypothetical protein
MKTAEMIANMTLLKTKWEAADQAGDFKERRRISTEIALIDPQSRRVLTEESETGPLDRQPTSTPNLVRAAELASKEAEIKRLTGGRATLVRLSGARMVRRSEASMV